MIDQRYGAAGTFTIPLSPRAPLPLREAVTRAQLGRLGYIAVTPTWQPAQLHTAASLLAQSMYTGVVVDRERSSVTGFGLEAFILGVAEHGVEVPPGITDPWNYNASTLDDALTAAGPVVNSVPIIPAGPITAGTISNDAWVVRHDYLHPVGCTSRAEAFQRVVDVFAAYWRVNPDGTLDASGDESDLYTVTPTVLIHEGTPSTESDITVLTGRVGDRRSNERWAATVRLWDGDTAAATALFGIRLNNLVHSISGDGLAIYDFHGSLVDWDYHENVNDDRASANQLADFALQLADRWDDEEHHLTVDLDVVEPHRHFGPGDHIWVYDLADGAFDNTNEVLAAGRYLHPLDVVVQSVRFPLRPPYGVWHIGSDFANTIRDLTPYIDWETDPVTIEVGAPEPPLGLTPPWQLRPRSRT